MRKITSIVVAAVLIGLVGCANKPADVVRIRLDAVSEFLKLPSFKNDTPASLEEARLRVQFTEFWGSDDAALAAFVSNFEKAMAKEGVPYTLSKTQISAIREVILPRLKRRAEEVFLTPDPLSEFAPRMREFVTDNRVAMTEIVLATRNTSLPDVFRSPTPEDAKLDLLRIPNAAERLKKALEPKVERGKERPEI